MNELNKLESFISDLSLYTRFDKDRIKVKLRENEGYVIIIDDIEWSNYLTFDDAKAELNAIFKGIKLGRGLI